MSRGTSVGSTPSAVRVGRSWFMSAMSESMAVRLLYGCSPDEAVPGASVRIEMLSE